MGEFNPSKDDYIYHYKDYIQHIQWLMEGMAWIQHQLMMRMLSHDRTKIEDDELHAYAEIVPGFKKFKYGTPEHKNHGDRLGQAWHHHTLHNRHHPEHFVNGIDEMNLIDLIEMVCDWRAASMRSGAWDYETSLNIFAKRFSPDDNLLNILLNTCKTIDKNCQSIPISQMEMP